MKCDLCNRDFKKKELMNYKNSGLNYCEDCYFEIIKDDPIVEDEGEEEMLFI
jgi:ribosome-binding protein aMBF1 (putative translation factor)